MISRGISVMPAYIPIELRLKRTSLHLKKFIEVFVFVAKLIVHPLHFNVSTSLSSRLSLTPPIHSSLPLNPLYGSAIDQNIMATRTTS